MMIWSRIFLALGLFCAATPVLALGGSASGAAGSGLGERVIMVLGKRGNACSGTVIAPDIVITAAHCVQKTKEVAIAYYERGGPVLQRVRRIVIHPKASRDFRRSIDVAMIQLAEPLPGRFRPSQMISASNGYGEGAGITLAGYGLQRNKDPKSAGTLRSAGALILSPQTRRIIRIGRADNPDALRICKGDSGGPVFDDKGILVAVTFGTEVDQQGSECGTVGQAIKLAPIRDWVDATLAKWR